MVPFVLPNCMPWSARIDAFLRRSIGLRPGEPVAIYRTNDRSCFHWFLAIIRAGGIAVPLNPQLSLSEVSRILADSGTEILVTDKAVFERTIVNRSALNVRTWIQADDEAETMDGFVRAELQRRAVATGHHRSGGNHCGLSYLRHKRIPEGSGSFEQCTARSTGVHGAFWPFPGPEGSCACRTALVAHYGHRALHFTA